MKKVACMWISLLLCVLAFGALPASAIATNEAEVTLKADSTSLQIGSEVAVSVNLKCGADIKGYNLFVNFDKNVFEWVSGGTSRISGVNGDFMMYDHTGDDTPRVRVVYLYKGTGTIMSGDAKAVTLKFKVKTGATGGDTSFSASSAYNASENLSNAEDIRKKVNGAVLNKSGTSCSVTYNPVRVTVSSTQNVKSNTKLKSLAAQGCTLSPAFSSSKTTYTLYAPPSVKTIKTNAKTENANATVKIAGISSGGVLKKITVTVTAADGETKEVYTMNVVRSDPPASNTSSDTSSNTSSDDSSSTSSVSSEASSSGESSSSEASSALNIVPSAAAPVIVDSTPSSSEASSSEEVSRTFLGTMLHQGKTLVTNVPLMILLGLFVLLVLLVVALPLSKRKKRKYINELLRRGYIINPQLHYHR